MLKQWRNIYIYTRRYVLQSSVTDEGGCSQLRGFPSMRTVGVPNPSVLFKLAL